MNRVKKLREERGIRQIDLAKQLNVSQGTLSNWEREVHDPDNDSLIKLSDFFNTTVDYLLGNSNIQTQDEQEEKAFWELRKEMAERPEMKTLFSLAKGAKEEDIKFANNLLKRLKGESEN